MIWKTKKLDSKARQLNIILILDQNMQKYHFTDLSKNVLYEKFDYSYENTRMHNSKMNLPAHNNFNFHNN